MEADIYFGSYESPVLHFTGDNNIESLSYNNDVDIIGDELTSDTVEFSVFYDDADNVLKSMAYATPILIYDGETLVGKYYFSDVNRNGVSRWIVHGTSLIGLIEKEKHYGGFYSGEYFPDVLKELLFTDGIKKSKAIELYTPVSNVINGRPNPAVRISDEAKDMGYNLRLRSKFVVIGKNGYSLSSNDHLLGDNSKYYTVSANVHQTDEGYDYWNFTVTYGLGNSISCGNNVGDSESYQKIGNGSVVTVDINPYDLYISLDIDYVLPGETEISGHISKKNTFYNLYNYEVDLRYAYAERYSSTTGACPQLKLQWIEQKVWKKGTLVVDVVFVKDYNNPSSGALYNYKIVNAVSGYAVITNKYDPYGDELGYFYDYTRLYRDIELSKSLRYSDIVSAVKVYGWIEDGTKRDALHKLIFSNNVNMIKAEDGGILFTELNYGEPQLIDDERIFDDPSERAVTGAKKISITEHSYVAGSASETIFDNSDSALKSGQYIAKFRNAPISGTPTGNGITILYSNCNAALVTGRGTITGTPYLHSESVIQYVNTDLEDGEDKSVSGIGLITGVNSDNVMAKLKSYYSGELSKVRNSIALDGERCGINYRFKSLFYDENSGFLTKVSARVSTFIKAVCEFVSGFVAVDVGGYTNNVQYAAGETWNVPSETRGKASPTVRLTLIGNGTAGTAGTNGEAGTLAGTGTGNIKNPGKGGKGGKGGVGGSGGRIYYVTVNVADVNRIDFSVSGSDLVAKTYNDSGTLLNTYSSASGNTSSNGFVDTFTGIVYALPGEDGFDGGNGGNGGYTETSKNPSTSATVITEINGDNGGNVESWFGGKVPNAETSSKFYTRPSGKAAWTFAQNSCGGGGGAAYGNNGGDSAFTDKSLTTYDYYRTAGGKGANATVRSDARKIPGSGGYGGNGGGGGGGAGASYLWNRYNPSTDQYVSEATETGTAGAGGTGSAGTAGIAGCAIIYY